MPRIQTFVSNKVLEDIDALITERRQEGADENELTMSSFTSMLIELGLRVYRLQREKKESGFSQMEFNRHILDNILRTRAMCTEVMRMCALSHEAISNGDFDIEELKKSVADFSKSGLEVFFHTDDEDSDR